MKQWDVRIHQLQRDSQKNDQLVEQLESIKCQLTNQELLDAINDEQHMRLACAEYQRFEHSNLINLLHVIRSLSSSSLNTNRIVHGNGESVIKTNFTVATYQNKREYMEDRHITRKSCRLLDSDNETRYGFYLVADGHGGQIAADFIKQRFFQKLKLTSKTNPRKNPTSWLINTVNELSAEWLEDPDFDHSGCTIATMLIDKEKRKAYLLHLGDSRIVLIDKISGSIIHQTKDHDLEDENVRNQINSITFPDSKRKCRVTKDRGPNDCWRVNGILNMARSFGDDSPDLIGCISHESEVATIDLSNHSSLDVIIASDGLFDDLKMTDLMNFVSRHKKIDADQLLEKLKQSSQLLGSNASNDNVTIISVQIENK